MFLVGTSHLARRSEEHVERVLRAVQPSQVVVELCGSRQQLLYPPETINDQTSNNDNNNNNNNNNSGDTDSPSGTGGGGKGGSRWLGIGGSSAQQALARSVRLGGWQGLLLQFTLAEFVGSAAQQLRGAATQPGQELVVARQIAEEIGAEVVLGDRPIQITMQRCWQALSSPEKRKLLQALVQVKRQPSMLAPPTAGGASSQQGGASNSTMQLPADGVISQVGCNHTISRSRAAC